MRVETAGRTDWHSWIERFRNTTLKTYENEPDRIREDFASELRVSDDYKGRALLELLQNADDAQQPESEVTASIGGHEVVFILTRKAFYCANGGYTMTRQGLNSICRLSHSPKDRSKLTIGEKGLGFKSVLSFSKSPEIHSGDLHCRFDRQEVFEFISSSEIIREKRPDLTYDKVPLLRVPIWCDSNLWEYDSILVELAHRYATIIKLPILEKDFDVVREKLEDIKPPILLFLNFLETIEIRVEGEKPRRCCIVREKLIQHDSCEVVRSLLEGEGEDTSWCTIKGAFDVPEDKLEGLAHSWENVKKCGVAFAMQEDNAGYLPLGKSFDNSIRVFFPTKESFPLPLLFHATYYADSARKTINIEHKYNQFLTEKAVEFFVSSVIPRLTDSKFAEDPCAHLDLLTRSSQREKTVGAYFGDLLFQALLETNIIPDSKGVLREPKELKKLPFDTAKWEEWYSLLGEEGCADLRLVHIDCRKPDRFQLLLDLDVEMLSFEEVVQSLEVHVVKDKNAVWFSKLYQEIAEYGQTRFGEERESIDRICNRARLLFTSDSEIVSGNETKVFMPPESENIGTVPKWLDVKFVHPEVIKGLGQNRERVLNTFLERFGVTRFQIRDIVREVLSTKVDEYWQGENTSLVPIDLLRFLFNLLGRELGDKLTHPEKQTYSILLKVPVPAVDPSGQLHWSKAEETDFRHHWLGNNFLEKLYDYDPNSRFLCGRDYFTANGFSSDSIFSFLYYLGVENQPRLLEATNVSEMRGFVDHECYDEYLRSNGLTTWTYGGYRHDLEYDCTVDRIEAIMRIPERSRTLLNYMARNSHPYLSTCDAKYKHYYYTWNYDYLETNYLKWLLQNFPWLYDSRDQGHKPNEIYVPYKSLIQRFSNYVPYVSWDSEESQASWTDIRTFLLRIGVKDNLEEFTLEQWYRIISKIPEEWTEKNITEEDAERVRAIYREFLRSSVAIGEEGKELREEFVKSGELLAFYAGKYSFYPVQEVFYVDRLDLFYQLKDFVPCFQIETNREQRVEELFSVPSLSSALEVVPDIGSSDPTLQGPLNAFLREAKPFLLARVRIRRNLKTDVSQIRGLVVKPVTRITVQRIVRHPSTGREVVIPNSEVDSVLLPEEQDGSKYWAIYIDARMIKRGVSNYTQFRYDDGLISTLSNRLSEMLRIDLSEAFQLILSKEAYSRKKLLQDNHIDDELLQECYTLLSQEEESPEDEEPTEPPITEEQLESEAEPEAVPVSVPDDNGIPKTHVLWGMGDQRLSYQPCDVEGKKIIKLQGKPGLEKPEPPIPKPHYQRDPDLRKEIDKAGMNIVMNYERSMGRVPDDLPSKQRGGQNRTGPGCDVYSRDKDGRLIRRIEVKSSLSDELESVELTRAELETARNTLTGQDFYLYCVIKLDKEKYPDGAELLIFHDPYREGIDKAIPVSIRFSLEDLRYDRVKVSVTQSAEGFESS